MNRFQPQTSNDARSLSRGLAFLLALCVLGGCSTTSRMIDKVPVAGRLVGEDGYFRDRQDEYLTAPTIERMDVPDALDSYIIDDLYVIPEVQGQVLADEGRIPRPRPLEGNSNRQVVIQTVDDERWIVAGASPAQIWPRVKDYWLSNRVTLTFENPVTGVMDTQWFALGQDSPTQEKVRVMIENGFQDNSSEIRVLQASAPRDQPAPAQMTFPETPDDPEVSNEIIMQMSQFLADVADAYQASTVSFMASSISSEGRASLQAAPDGSQRLVLDASMRRSWVAVGLALNRAEGVEVVSRNEDLGLYEVRYSVIEEGEEEPGFWGKLLSFGRDPVYTMWLQLEEEDGKVNISASEVSVDGKRDPEINASDRLVQLLRRVIA